MKCRHLETNIDISRNKENKKKIDIYIIKKMLSCFDGQEYEEKSLFASVYPSDKDKVIKQAHNCFSIT